MRILVEIRIAFDGSTLYNERMQFSGPAVLLTLVLVSALILSCSSPAGNSANSANAASSANAANSDVPKDNVGELLIHVRLPFIPEEVTWEEDAAKKTLVAVIRLSPDETEKMIAEVTKLGQPANETLTVESWYPAELRAQSELTGESAVNGRTYPADSFLNPPYTRGKLTHVENTDYFILHASS